MSLSFASTHTERDAPNSRPHSRRAPPATNCGYDAASDNRTAIRSFRAQVASHWARMLRQRTQRHCLDCAA
jgi:hypothetical protein